MLPPGEDNSAAGTLSMQPLNFPFTLLRESHRRHTFFLRRIYDASSTPLSHFVRRRFDSPW